MLLKRFSLIFELYLTTKTLFRPIMLFTTLMPSIVQDKIISYLDNVTLVQLSRVNQHLNYLCLKDKNWKQIIMPLGAILIKFESCEKVIRRYRHVLQDFTIQYDNIHDKTLIMEFRSKLESCLRGILHVLPNLLRKIQLPIYLFRNAVSGKISIIRTYTWDKILLKIDFALWLWQELGNVIFVCSFVV